MTAKGTAQPNAAMTNQFRLEIVGLPEIYFSRVGEIERMITLAELPDRTYQSTGQVAVGEFEADMMPHHDTEWLAVQAWHREVEAGLATAKRPGTLYALRANGQVARALQLDGVLLKGWKLPEFATGEDGSGVVATLTLTYDDVIAFG